MKRTEKIFRIIFLLLACAFFTACDYGMYFFASGQDDADGRASSLSVLSGENLPELDVTSMPVYSFAIISDVHIGTTLSNNRDDKAFIKSFMELLKSSDPAQRPQFVISLGDELDSGRKWQADEYNKLLKKISDAAKAELGVSRYHTYSIVGNHDLYNNGWNIWKTEIYPYRSFYKIPLGNFSYYILDTGNGTLGYKQLEAFEREIRKDTNKKICFSHYPFYANGIWLFTIQDTKERARVLTALVNNDFLLLGEGHKHKLIECSMGDLKERVMGSLTFQRVYCLVTVDNNNQTVSTRTINF